MIYIPLGHKIYTRIDDEDYIKIIFIEWHLHNKGYARGNVNGKKKYMHQLILGVDCSVQVDHIDKDKLNNQRYNLRIADNSTNHANTILRRDNKTGHKGVCLSSTLGKWRATIQKDNHSIHIGTFDNPEEAARAYDARAKILFGEFASLNFED